MYILLLLACCYSAPAEVVVDNDAITLGLLVPLPQTDGRAALSFGLAPGPGLSSRLPRYEITGKLMAAGLQSDDIELPESILVRRRSYGLDRDQVAGTILALCSGLLDAMNGQVVMVDHGATFFDNLMRFYAERDTLVLPAVTKGNHP